MGKSPSRARQTTRPRRDAHRTELSDPMIALSVYDGSRCIGFMMPRGRQGVEAFDADDRSLGFFADQKSAADAISAAAEAMS